MAATPQAGEAVAPQATTTARLGGSPTMAATPQTGETVAPHATTTPTCETTHSPANARKRAAAEVQGESAPKRATTEVTITVTTTRQPPPRIVPGAALNRFAALDVEEGEEEAPAPQVTDKASTVGSERPAATTTNGTASTATVASSRFSTEEERQKACAEAVADLRAEDFASPTPSPQPAAFAIRKDTQATQAQRELEIGDKRVVRPSMREKEADALDVELDKGTEGWGDDMEVSDPEDDSQSIGSTTPTESQGAPSSFQTADTHHSPQASGDLPSSFSTARTHPSPPASVASTGPQSSN